MRSSGPMIPKYLGVWCRERSCAVPVCIRCFVKWWKTDRHTALAMTKTLYMVRNTHCAHCPN